MLLELTTKLDGAGRLAAVVAPNLTVEEAYLLCKWIRAVDGTARGQLGPDAFFQLGVEPCACVSPVAIGGCRRNAQGGGCLRYRQTREVAQLDQAGLLRIYFLEAFQGFVYGQHVQGWN